LCGAEGRSTRKDGVMTTWLPKDPGEKRPWALLDAADKPLGRLAVRIANMLRGKHRPTYSPHVDTGDFVVVINAEKVKLTGKKNEQKEYLRFSGYRSGLRRIRAREMRKRHPDWMIRLAVKRMLPKNHMSRRVIRRLKVYAGAEHPHAAQKPQKAD
jgi:large subunit ribosomal protein L13